MNRSFVIALVLFFASPLGLAQEQCEGPINAPYPLITGLDGCANIRLLPDISPTDPEVDQITQPPLNPAYLGQFRALPPEWSARIYQSEMDRMQNQHEARKAAINALEVSPQTRYTLLQQEVRAHNRDATELTALLRAPAIAQLGSAFGFTPTEGKPPVVTLPDGRTVLNTRFGVGSDFDAGTNSGEYNTEAEIQQLNARLQAMGLEITARRPRSFDIGVCRSCPGFAGLGSTPNDYIQYTINITPDNMIQVQDGVTDIEAYVSIATETVYGRASPGSDTQVPFQNVSLEYQRVLDNANKIFTAPDVNAEGNYIDTFNNNNLVSTQFKAVYKNLAYTTDSELNDLLQSNGVVNQLTGQTMTAQEYRTTLGDVYSKQVDISMLNIQTNNNINGLLQVGRQVTSNIVERVNTNSDTMTQAWQNQIDSQPPSDATQQQQEMLDNHRGIVEANNAWRQAEMTRLETPSPPVPDPPPITQEVNARGQGTLFNTTNTPTLLAYQDFVSQQTSQTMNSLYSRFNANFDAQNANANNARNSNWGRGVTTVNKLGVGLVVYEAFKKAAKCRPDDYGCKAEQLSIAGFDFLTDEAKDEVLQLVSPQLALLKGSYEAGYLVGSMIDASFDYINVGSETITIPEVRGPDGTVISPARTETRNVTLRDALVDIMASANDVYEDNISLEESNQQRYMEYLVFTAYEMEKDFLEHHNIKRIDYMNQIAQRCGSAPEGDCAKNAVEGYTAMLWDRDMDLPPEEQYKPDICKSNPTFPSCVDLRVSVITTAGVMPRAFCEENPFHENCTPVQDSPSPPIVPKDNSWNSLLAYLEGVTGSAQENSDSITFNVNSDIDSNELNDLLDAETADWEKDLVEEQARQDRFNAFLSGVGNTVATAVGVVTFPVWMPVYAVIEAQQQIEEAYAACGDDQEIGRAHV